MQREQELEHHQQQHHELVIDIDTQSIPQPSSIVIDINNESINNNDHSDHSEQYQYQHRQKQSIEKHHAPPLFLQWSNIEFSVKIKKKVNKKWRGMFFQKELKQILYGQSGYVKPGEIMAIMGPSGCGKTSMYLNIYYCRL
jgi:ABC-type glutathione transport system ATPase component